MKRLYKSFLMGLAIAMFSGVVHPQGEIKGYMVGEYYNVVKHNNSDLEGWNGFWFRRIYFTYNNMLSDTVKVRLRYEMASPGDFSSDFLLGFVKDAYISFKLGQKNLTAGIQSPPSFRNIEDIWGYRSLEKTPLDLYKWTSSRDFGVSLSGGKSLIWEVMLANGSSNKAEADRGKKLLGLVGYRTSGFHFEFNGHYEKRKKVWTEYILHVHATHSGEWGRAGIEYAFMEQIEDIKDDVNKKYKYNIFSAFIIFPALKRIDFIARYDKNWGGGYTDFWKGSKVSYIPFNNYAEPNVFIGAVSWQAHKNVWLIPNIKNVGYSNPREEKSKGAVYVNLTLWFKY